MKKNEVIEKKKKERFEIVVDLHLGKDIVMKIEPGSEPEISVRTLKQLYNLSRLYNEKQLEIDNLCKRKEELKKEIVDIIKTHNGSRGIISRRDNFNLTVSPAEHTVWNDDKLRKSLGKWRSMVINRIFTVNVTLPTPYMLRSGNAPLSQKKAIEQAVKKAILSLGVPEPDLNRLVKTETSINVDEQFLNGLLADKRVKLLPGTKKSEITWRVRVDPLRSK